MRVPHVELLAKASAHLYRLTTDLIILPEPRLPRPPPTEVVSNRGHLVSRIVLREASYMIV